MLISGVAGAARFQTDFGLVPAMLILAGDRVQGADGTWHRVISISKLAFDVENLAENPGNRGVSVPEGALGGGLPKTGIILGPDQAVRHAASQFDGALTRVSDHVGNSGIAPAPIAEVVFYRLRFDAEVVVLVEGAPVAF